MNILHRCRLRTAFALFVTAVFTAGTLHTQPKSIVILHTNDLHANFLPHEASWVRESPHPLIGGFCELEYTVDSIRKELPAALLLDAGDVMTGNPVTEYRYAGARGGALIEMMNMTGYDAWCPGNHDFDISRENFVALSGIARFPTLCANLADTNAEFIGRNTPFAIIEKGGFKIGIIGIISPELFELVNDNVLFGTSVYSPAVVVQPIIDSIAPRVDAVVALTHEGVDLDSALAEGVHGLQAIIGGHSHTRLYKPRIINGVLIVQAGSNCENLGVLRLTVENRRLISYDGKLIPLWRHTERPATVLKAFVDSVGSAIDRDYGQVLAIFGSDWSGKGSGKALGLLITEAQRDATHADFSIMNTHGIRKGISPGPLTKKGLFEILPFRNVLTTFSMSGGEIREMVRFHLQEHTPVIFSGLSCEWTNTDEKGITIVSLRIGEKEIEDSGMYTGAANDFIVDESLRYLGAKITGAVYLKQTLFEAVEHSLWAQRNPVPPAGLPFRKIR